MTDAIIIGLVVFGPLTILGVIGLIGAIIQAATGQDN